MIDASMRSPAGPRELRGHRPYREFLFRYLRPQIGRVILMAVILLAGIAIKLLNPQVLRYFLDAAQTEGGELGELRRLSTAAVLFLAFAILGQVMTLVTQYTAA